MLKTFAFGDFGIVITDNIESVPVIFEPEIDSVISDNMHDRMIFKNGFDSLASQYSIIEELALSLDPKLHKEIMDDIDWLFDYLDNGYTKDYKFNLQEEGWVPSAK
jgi:hypothetical protein